MILKFSKRQRCETHSHSSRPRSPVRGIRHNDLTETGTSAEREHGGSGVGGGGGGGGRAELVELVIMYHACHPSRIDTVD